MNNIQFKKDKISIKNIGVKRFWIGVFVGILSAVSFSLFLNYSREALRIFTSIRADLFILNQKELKLFNIFFCFVSTVLAFSVTMWFWMGSLYVKRRKDNIYKQLAKANAILICIIVFLLIIRIGSLYSLFLYGTNGYDNHFNLIDEYPIIFLLLPLVIFFQNWLVVRRIYLVGKWIVISFLMCLLVASFLFCTTTVNQDRINGVYYKMHENEYLYIENELNTAKILYGINYEDSTVKYLKKRTAENSYNQVAAVKRAFSGQGKVTLDTIIMQKIMIHNTKKSSGMFYKYHSFDNWFYALPEDVLRQIYLFNPEDAETKELFNILKEQIELVNTFDVDLYAGGQYSKEDIYYRRNYVRYYLPFEIFNQLYLIRDNLINNKQYSELVVVLPEVIIHEDL